MYKYELHAHTMECDIEATLSGREMVRLYKESGYDGIVITNHFFEKFFTHWFKDEI